MMTQPEVFNVDNPATFTVSELKEVAEDFSRMVVERGDKTDLTGFWELIKSKPNISEKFITFHRPQSLSAYNKS